MTLTERRELVAALTARGHSPAGIAARIGVHPATIHRDLRPKPRRNREVSAKESRASVKKPRRNRAPQPREPVAEDVVRFAGTLPPEAPGLTWWVRCPAGCHHRVATEDTSAAVWARCPGQLDLTGEA